MATNIDYTGATYIGQVATEWYGEAVLNGPTISEERCRILTTVKNKVQIPGGSVSNLLAARTCEWNPSGDVNIELRELSVVALKVSIEECFTTFEPLWLADRARAGQSETIPDDFQEWLMGKIAERIAMEVEQAIWRSDTTIASPPQATYLTFFDGWLVQFEADANVEKISGTTITSSNIIDEMQKLYDAVPDTLKAEAYLGEGGSTAIYMSVADYGLYRTAILTGSPIAYVNSQGVNLENFQGLRIFVTPGMPKNNMVFASVNNLWVGTDLTEDFARVTMLDFRETTGADKWGLKANMNLGVAYGVPSEIKYYRP